MDGGISHSADLVKLTEGFFIHLVTHPNKCIKPSFLKWEYNNLTKNMRRKLHLYFQVNFQDHLFASVEATAFFALLFCFVYLKSPFFQSQLHV